MAIERAAVEKPTSSRPSLINLVGAPLEDVVGSAETSEEGDTHLMMELVAVVVHCIQIIQVL